MFGMGTTGRGERERLHVFGDRGTNLSAAVGWWKLAFSQSD